MEVIHIIILCMIIMCDYVLYLYIVLVYGYVATCIYNLMASANEHDKPVPSGSTCNEVTVPFSTTIE